MKKKEATKPKISRKQFEIEKRQARAKAFMKVIKDTFKDRKVNTSKPLTVTIDEGGIYLDTREKGDRLKTFIIISWVANNELKDFILSFSNVLEAKQFTKVFKKEFKNTRILQAIE